MNCPVSCGLCCRDNDSYTFVNVYDQTIKTCAWITKKPDPRAANNCGSLSHGQIVYDTCQSACGKCNEFIYVAPSATSSGAPSNNSSILPTDLLSKTPTDEPSISPTGLSSIPSSRKPSATPSLAPTQ